MFRSNRLTDKNIFKTQMFKIEEDQFPEIGTYTIKPSPNLNFKDATTREIPINNDNTKFSLKKGYEAFQYNKISGETIVKKWVYGNVVEQTLVEYLQDDEDDEIERDTRILEQLISNWQTRSKEYDDIHGEGEYEKLYSIYDDDDNDDELDDDVDDE